MGALSAGHRTLREARVGPVGDSQPAAANRSTSTPFSLGVMVPLSQVAAAGVTASALPSSTW